MHLSMIPPPPPPPPPHLGTIWEKRLGVDRPFEPHGWGIEGHCVDWAWGSKFNLGAAEYIMEMATTSNNSDANQFNSSPIATSPLDLYTIPMVRGGGNMREVHPRSAPPMGQSTLRFGQIPTNAPPCPRGGGGGGVSLIGALVDHFFLCMCMFSYSSFIKLILQTSWRDTYIPSTRSLITGSPEVIPKTRLRNIKPNGPV